MNFPVKNSKAVLTTPGNIQIQKTAVADLGEDEVLIKVEYVGICGSDVHSFESGPFFPPSDPNTEVGLGHECAGEIVAVGEKVFTRKVGEKVVIEPGIPCGKCKLCLEGHYNLWWGVDLLGTRPTYRGALTEFLAFPESMTFSLPDNVDTLEGALVEPAAVGFHAAMMADVRPGKKVVILGTGCIGLMTLQACKLLGSTQIIVVDVIKARLELAKKLGATHTINARETDTIKAVKDIIGEMGAEIIFETAGSQITAKQAPLIVSRGGKIMIVGTIAGETPINFLKINREVTIQTVFIYPNTFPMVIDAISAGRFDVKSMITNVYEYKNVQEAFQKSISDKESNIKGVIKVS